MSNECMRVQEIASAISDGEASAQEVAFAKAHCSSCAACAQFVRGLQALRATAAPDVPEQTMAHVLALVRAEMQASHAALLPMEPDTDSAEPAPGVASPLRRIGVGLTRMSWTGWATAAALLIVAAFVTVRGIAYLTAPGEQMAGSADSALTGLEFAPESSGVASDETLGAAEEPKEMDGSRFLTSAEAAPPYIVFDGAVYLVDPEERTLDASATSVGTSRTSLDQGPAGEHRVFSTPDPSVMLVEVSSTTARQATLVTRGYAGRRFALRSGPIDSFGVWPTLPRDVPLAIGDDGAPVVVLAGVDERGTQIHVRAGANPGDGFAVAPQLNAQDPSAGNPNWTWWEPIP